MTRFSRMQVLTEILDRGVVPIFNTPDAAIGIEILKACSNAGATVLEYTNRGDNALEVFRALVSHVRRTESPVMLGAGTILDGPTAALFIAEGADFIVGPTLSAEVARLCNRRKVAYLPGCMTATEVSDAEELGCEIVKLFPQAALDGSAWLRSVLGPMPWSRIVPTGSKSDERTIRSWFAAGAAGVGIGPDLFTPDRLITGDFETIERQVRDALAWARDARIG